MAQSQQETERRRRRRDALRAEHPVELKDPWTARCSCGWGRDRGPGHPFTDQAVRRLQEQHIRELEALQDLTARGGDESPLAAPPMPHLTARQRLRLRRACEPHRPAPEISGQVRRCVCGAPLPSGDLRSAWLSHMMEVAYSAAAVSGNSARAA